MARKEKSTQTHHVKTLRPNELDSKHIGQETEFLVQPDPEKRLSTISRCLSWYNIFYGRKEARDVLAEYLIHKDRSIEAATIAKVADSEIIPTYGWLGRLVTKGLKLTDTENVKLEDEIGRLISTVVKDTKTVDVKESNRPNIQEILRQKAVEAAGELEGMFDDYLSQGAKSKHTFNPMEELSKKNVVPQHLSIITDVWKQKLEEFELVLEGDTPQLVEGYQNFDKIQIKNIIKFIELVLASCNNYISSKKASKAPRKRKAVPVEKIVSKLKYLRTFKDVPNKIDLTSISPTKLHGSTEAWVYDTAKRKLYHYLADDYSKTLVVKGNTLQGFDVNTSESKTLRKPNEQLKEIMGSKPAARKFFKDIKAVSTTPKGRFNPDIIILKAF
tara:strand:- start:2427 stop:3587 length:1161 start_codon:yes stop_codon:yes gene_type:complete